jgi:hypothetical protein
MFLIDIPFKDCQGCSNRSSIVHVVSLTLNAFLIFFAYHCCFAYDFQFLKLFENFVVHAVSMIPHALCSVNAVSMTPHALCMRYQ